MTDHHKENRQDVIEVAVALPVDGPFHYLVPVSHRGRCLPGTRVLAPFGPRQVTGYVLRSLSEGDLPKDGPALKAIIRPLDDEPLFGWDMLAFFAFIANYYHYPMGLVIAEALPAGLNVKSQRAALLTEAGLAALNDGTLPESELAILKAMDVPKGLLLTRAKKMAGVKPSLIAKWERDGLISLGASLRSDRVRSQVRKWLTAVSEEVPGRLGPKEKELLDLLKEAGPTSMDDLRDRFTGLPELVKRLAAKERLTIEERVVYRDDLGRALDFNATWPDPSPNQAEAISSLKAAIDAGSYTPFVLHGITGSGKTEVYLAAARHALSIGRSVLFLVPEISLTPALEGLLRARFEENVAVLHSGMSDGERYDQWLKIRRKESRLILGARSAIFAPAADLGLIVVDEEHDGAFKQEEKLRYQARDLAVLRASQAKATVCLGSATPSLETFFAAKSGRYKLLTLNERIGEGRLPSVEVVDLRYDSGRRRGALTPTLKQALRETLAAGHQALLFINRRGTAGLPLCLACGHVIKCLNCSVTLTLHQRTACGCEDQAPDASGLDAHVLNCHHCGLEMTPPDRCPSCQSKLFRYLGIGTERLEKEVQKAFPEARVARLDADTARLKNRLTDTLKGLRDRTVDILVGTQMITKGHDFPNITLVGVIEADLGLHLPDFRAGERTFQLLAQVGGRAGRGGDAGRVIVQTYSPEHYTLLLARQHDYLGFFEEELAQRRDLRYPPFARLAMIRLAGNSEEKTALTARDAVETGLRFIEEARIQDIELLGPAPAPLAKIKGKYRYQVMVRAARVKTLHAFLDRWLPVIQSQNRGGGVTLTADIDPYSMM